MLRCVYGFVKRMLGMHGFVHRLFELLMTVALVGRFLRLSGFLVFVNCVVMRVVPIFAGPRRVLRHAVDASSVCSFRPVLHHFFMHAADTLHRG